MRFLIIIIISFGLSFSMLPSPAISLTPDNASVGKQTNEQVNVYSYRQPFLVQPLFERFTQHTGIKVRVVFAKKGLIERMQAEGVRSPADLVLTTDIGRLVQAAETIGQRVVSPVLRRHIPAMARDGDSKWFALTLRARVIYASKARTRLTALSYRDLVLPQWHGRVCMRSGQHAYNNALFAAMLAELGETEFRNWLIGLKTNLAEKPSGNDRAQVRRVYGGTCDLAIGNTYYMGKMQTNEKKPEQKKWASAVRLIFPTMPNGSTHVNVSGMVLSKHAPNRANAVKLMIFLISEEAQKIYAEVNFEYPVRAGVPVSARVASWGTLTPDLVALDKIARYRKRASEIVDEVQFNAGP